MNDLVEYLKSPYVLGERHASPGELVDQMLSKMKEAADHIEAQNKLIEEMREALQSACEELYQISHSGGDPNDENNMDSYAAAYRECRSALSKSNPNTPERNDE